MSLDAPVETMAVAEAVAESLRRGRTYREAAQAGAMACAALMGDPPTKDEIRERVRLVADLMDPTAGWTVYDQQRALRAARAELKLVLEDWPI